MAMKRKTTLRPRKYPDEMRVRAYELWRAKDRSLFKVRRRLSTEYPRAPHITTLKHWMDADNWKEKADALETRLSSFTGFKQYVWQQYEHAAHLELIDTKLTEAVRYLDSGGQEGIRRLMIFLPPRHGKSMTVSRLFPAWFLGTHPDFRVILTGYGWSLVGRHSLYTRKIMRSARYREVFPDLKIAREDIDRGSWNIARHEGGLDAMGIRGAVTGKGANLLIIDDPVKNRLAVASRYQRDSLWESYQYDLFTRLEPNGAIVLMMTRWHEDDLAGRLLKTEGDKWEVIRLAAIAEEQPQGTDKNITQRRKDTKTQKEEGKEKIEQETQRHGDQQIEKFEQEGTKTRRNFEQEEGREGESVDVLGRKVGESLWAERYSVSELEEIRASIGAMAFAALYQQNPMPMEGGLFKLDWVETKRSDNVPLLSRIYVGVDPAASVGERAAETGIIVAGVDKRTPSHAYVLADLSVKASPAEWARIALEAVKTWKADAIVLEVNQGGEMAANTLKAINPNVRIQKVHATRDKFLRADPVAALYEQGRVHHAGMFPALEEQMIRWTPGDPSPDRLDALVWALTELMLKVQGIGFR